MEITMPRLTAEQKMKEEISQLKSHQEYLRQSNGELIVENAKLRSEVDKAEEKAKDLREMLILLLGSTTCQYTKQNITEYLKSTL